MLRLARRWIAALGLLTAAGVLWRRRWGYGVRRREREVARLGGQPPPPPPDVPGRPRLQRYAHGTGPRFHRRYRVDVAETALTPEVLFARIEADVQAFVPAELARFERTRGAPDRLAVGDEFHIHITAPWDGPVRVVEKTPASFTFGTLEGHLEAGQVRFRAERHPSEAGALRFTIESWARSRDGGVDLAYDRLGLAKKAQEAMWTFFCDRVADACGGRKLGEIEVLTEREVE